MNKINYQLRLDAALKEIKESGEIPSLLLHSCCAPCSSYVLEYLSEYFNITVFYYNPNITEIEEFDKRAAEQKRLLCEMPLKNRTALAVPRHNPEEFLNAAKGLYNEPEGGERCTVCYSLRLEETARYAKEHGFSYFTTTLSVSPYKDAVRLNLIGEEAAKKYGVAYLPADFKKREGYKRSCALSEKYGLYRQNYCGCPFSRSTIK